ncbi:MAG: hypothetical protein ABIH21_05590 [Patescibacteria group bacterium]
MGQNKDLIEKSREKFRKRAEHVELQHRPIDLWIEIDDRTVYAREVKSVPNPQLPGDRYFMGTFEYVTEEDAETLEDVDMIFLWPGWWMTLRVPCAEVPVGHPKCEVPMIVFLDHERNEVGSVVLTTVDHYFEAAPYNGKIWVKSIGGAEYHEVTIGWEPVECPQEVLIAAGFVSRV